ncbi:F-box domain containing protein [Pandoravirus salinus]|uniref:F-box domain containing protein n=1 Tax=Pandoravirus salinus TaxID=1349410 RepID=S4W1U1_9VIRU|nr:F-box domain [Pandoravirus salinus]AGO84402.1 F-box domain containing protein [Pandoravirus salinus]
MFCGGGRGRKRLGVGDWVFVLVDRWAIGQRIGCVDALDEKKRRDIVVSVAATTNRTRIYPMTTTTNATADATSMGLLALPDEILFAIIAMCPRRPVSLARIGAVCRRLYRLCEDDVLWEPVAARMAGQKPQCDWPESHKGLAHRIRSTDVDIRVIDARTGWPDPRCVVDDLSRCGEKATVALERIATPFRLACVVASIRMHSPMRIHLWIKSEHADSLRLVYAPRPSAPLLDKQPWWAALMVRSTRDGLPAVLAVDVVVVCRRGGALSVPPCVAAAAISRPVDLHNGQFPRVQYSRRGDCSALAHLPDCRCVVDKK